MKEKKGLTLFLSDAEMRALDSLAEKKELTKSALLRQALRLFELVDARISEGETMYFEDKKSKKKSELMVL